MKPALAMSAYSACSYWIRNAMRHHRLRTTNDIINVPSRFNIQLNQLTKVYSKPLCMHSQNEGSLSFIDHQHEQSWFKQTKINVLFFTPLNLHFLSECQREGI